MPSALNETAPFLLLLLLVLILIVLFVLLILVLVLIVLIVLLILVLILIILHFDLRSPPNEILQPQQAEHRLFCKALNKALRRARYYYAQKYLRYSRRYLNFIYSLALRNQRVL